MIKRKKKVKDDYGWFIFSKDAQNAAESLEKIHKRWFCKRHQDSLQIKRRSFEVRR